MKVNENMDQKEEQMIPGAAAENLRAYLAGRELRNVVDFTTGYKK